MYSTYNITLWRIRVTIVAMERLQYVRFFVLDVDVSVGGIKVYIVSMKMQQWVSFAVLSSCKIYRIIFTIISTCETLWVCLCVCVRFCLSYPAFIPIFFSPRVIVLSSVACPAMPVFPHFLINDSIFEIYIYIFRRCVFRRSVYSNNCSVINHNNTQTCGSPRIRFGLFRTCATCWVVRGAFNF